MAARKAPSIRRVVAVTMIVPVVALSVALTALAALAARRVAERLGAGALELATARVQAELGGYLGQAERLGDYTAALVADGRLPADDLKAWERAVLEQLQAFPGVTAAAFARSDGTLVGAMRRPEGIVLLRAADGVMEEWLPEEGNERGRDGSAGRAGEPRRRYSFDPRARPWHEEALRSEGPVWTAPYVYAGSDATTGQEETGASYARLVRGRDGTALGVLAVDVSFDALGRHLRANPLADAGRLLLVDDAGRLLASSQEDSSSATTRTIPDDLGRLLRGETASAEAVRVTLDGVPMWASATPMRAPAGAAGPGGAEASPWKVVAAVPERLVLAEARQAQALLLLVSLAALLLAVAASLWLARRLAAPVQELQEHVRRLGDGDFSQPPLHLHAARELQELSSDLNDMSAALKERLALQQSMQMARQVQQALLPPPSYARPGLELLGHSVACDSTGGDYFDFIELPGRDAVLVAIGDVMGHGVASALLMATARAALRSEVRRTESLGAMLLRVSSVLLQSRGHGRFMTMFLLLIEPRARRLRWANAGHEAALLFLPGNAAAVPLQGGDLPLGIDPGVVYYEHSMEDVPPGALIFLGTDGLRETMDAAGEPLGLVRLQDVLRRHASLPLRELGERLVEAVASHRGEARVRDDLTFVVGRLL